jgi:hypothetical protein
MTETHWHLYVDESGDFGLASDAACVAGVLARQSLAMPLEGAFSFVARHAWPHVPYPPHTCHLNIPFAHLVGWVRAGRPDVPESWQGLHGVDAIGTADLMTAPEPVRHAWQCAVTLKPDLPELEGLDAWFRAIRPDMHARLKALRDHSFFAAAHGLRYLTARLDGDLLLIAATDFAASEDDQATPERGPTRAGTERYLRLLRRVVERAALTIEARHRQTPGLGDPVLRLTVASRGTVDAAGTTRRLLRWDVQGAADLSSRPALGSDASCRLGPPTVADFDAQVAAGLVFADMGANRARSPLCSTKSLRDLEAWLLDQTGLMTQVVPGKDIELPTTACDTPYAEVIESALQGVRLAIPVRNRRWASQQARAWQEYLLPLAGER